MTILRRSEVDLQNDPDVIASRAVTPQFYRAPWPGHPDYTPSQYQHAGVEYRIARHNGLFGDAPGVGKAQPLDALVRVPGGWKKIGDLKVGDGLCGYDGKGGRVVGVYDRGEQDVYEVEFSDGAKTRVSEDHLWRVQTPKAKWFVAPTWLIAEKMKTSKVWIPMASPVGSSDGHWLPIDPYLVGLLLGDGGLTGPSVRITSVDQYIVDFCRTQAEKFGLKLVKYGECSYTFSAPRRRWGGNELLNRMRDIGLMGWGSPHKQIPDDYLYASAEHRLELLRGLMDSDGWITGGKSGFSSSSQELARGVQELVQSLGGVARASQKITASGKWAFILSINMPKNPFRLPRKANLWKPYEKYLPKRLFRSIRYVGREPVRCIEVTCADRLYLTDEYIVTHNTAECIMTSNAMRAKRTLVVCPASLRLNWEREIWVWANVENVSTYPVMKSSDGVSPEADYVIVSYDLLRNKAIMDALLSMRFDHLVLDEAHALKDPKGNKRTRAICAPDMLPSVVGAITMASGTILPNQPIECLGPDTLVLTDRGWVRIVQVTTEHNLWDGVQWVKHQGLVFRGEKETIKRLGVSLTPDHKILADGNWYSAKRLENVNIKRRALATASENLPWSRLTEGRREASGMCGFVATAAAAPISLLKHICDGVVSVAGLAGRKRALEKHTVNTPEHALTNSYGSACSPGYKTSCSGATIQKLRVSGPTEAEASKCSVLGAKTELNSWRILLLFLAAKTHQKRLTVSTWIEGTSRAIFGLLHGKRAKKELFGNSKNVSTDLKPVFDLVNAGPNRRFTILTTQGPLVVHNCYNAIRLLNWEAINKASLEEFRRFYYAKGGGMVRSPVWDEAKGAMVSKLHWSDEVRNQPRNLDDLQYRMRKHIMVRRLKEQVLHELPKKQWQLVPLQMTTALRKAMRHPGWATAQKLYELDPEAFDTAAIIDGAVASARRELGEAKAPPVADYIEELLRSGSEKLVVGAYHHSVLDFMKERLSKYGLAYMDGNTGSRRKQSEVDRFQSDPSCRIILGQMYAMGEGWTLTAAQDVVFCEPDWVPGKNDQFLDRVHRRGQRGKYVIGHMPIVPGTMDERIIGSAVKKDRHIHQALDAH